MGRNDKPNREYGSFPTLGVFCPNCVAGDYCPFHTRSCQRSTWNRESMTSTLRNSPWRRPLSPLPLERPPALPGLSSTLADATNMPATQNWLMSGLASKEAAGGIALDSSDTASDIGSS